MCFSLSKRELHKSGRMLQSDIKPRFGSISFLEFLPIIEF